MLAEHSDHNPDHLRFQRQQRRYSEALEPSQPVTSWGHDILDLALAAATVAALWWLVGLVAS